VTASPTTGRARRSPVDRYDERRDQLAESALQTLGERGYANTSLRDIATNSPFSHGVLHYYFDDKLDLIDYCIRFYKARCVTRYDAVVSDSTSPGGLLDAFADKLVETIVEEAPMHRLWYDIRTQSMFEERLRPAATYIDQTLEDMVWRIIGRYAELSDLAPAMTPAAAYGVLDGLFQAALYGYSLGDETALPTLVDQVHGLMPLTIGPAGTH
jgi:TetR/AcrR family transcriptional repressor of bet genes